MANFGTSSLGVCMTGVITVHAYREIIRSAKIQEIELQSNRTEIIVTKEDRVSDLQNIKKENFLNRTVNYISRWNQPEFTSFRETMGCFFEKS